MKKKLLAMMLVLALACTGLTACGGGNGDGSKVGKTELTLWSTYTADSNAKLGELVAKFNNENENYEVKLEIGQSASGNRQKLAASTPDYYPSMFFGTNNTIFEYAESKYTASLQDFIDKDSEDWTADMLPSVKAAYSDGNGKLVGAPVGVSVKGYMVNTDYLEAAGYKLEDMTSFEKIAEASTTAKNKDICLYPYIPSDGSDILNMLLYQGVDIFDAGNGYDGTVKKALYDKGETNKALTKYVELLSGLYKIEAAMNNPNGSDGGTASFINGQAMFWACTSSFVYEFSDLDIEFNWAFLPFKGVDDNAKYKDAALAEGTGIFIGNTGDEDEMQGAYEFIKFLAKPENQIFWSTFRGYTPYTKAALESTDWTTWRDANYPSEAAVEKILQSENAELRFPKTTLVSKVLSVNKDITSNIMADPKGSASDYIKSATKSLQDSIDMLNARNK